MPEPDATTPPRRLPRVRIVYALLRGYPVHVSILVLGSFVTGVLEAAFLVAATRVALAVADGADTVYVTRGVELSIAWALAAAGLLVVIRLISNLVTVRVSLGLSFRVTRAFRSRLAEAYLDASWLAQREQGRGSLQQLLVESPRQVTGLVSSAAAALGVTLSLFAMLATAVVVDPAATVVVVLSLMLMSAVVGPLRRRVERRSRAAIDHQMAFADRVSEVGDLTVEVRTFGVSRAVQEHLTELVDQDLSAQRRVNLVAQAMSPIYISVGYGLILVAVAVITLLGEGQLGSVGAVMIVMLRSLAYGQQMQGSIASTLQQLPLLDRIEQTIADLRAAAPVRHGTTIDRVGPIEFDRAAFAYPGTSHGIRDVSLRVEPGEAIGVIGPSGSGKSTLIRMVLGLISPDSGNVTVDGVAISDIDRAAWSNVAAFVPQDSMLLSGTIADNLAFFRNGISEARMLDALAAAGLSEDLARMPRGLATEVGEGGRRLSGGQRQRLAIARALVGRPQLLVLDEPTAALDVESESIVRETLLKLKGSCTVMVIAHRLTTLHACDRIVVVQDGVVRSVGTPTELEATDAYYRRVLELSEVQ